MTSSVHAEAQVDTGSDTGLSFDPALLVLRRADGRVQVGWGPETGRVIVPPAGLDEFDVRTVLQLLDGAHTDDEIVETAVERGADAGGVRLLLDDLVATGLVRGTASTKTRVAPTPAHRIRLYGDGPLADALCAQLALRDTKWSRAGRYTGDERLQEGLACVVLADIQVPDPLVVRDLMRHRVPHLVVRTRDGRGIVGPFVVPGSTSCLRCADLTRTDLDPSWPVLAAQLWDRPGHAARAVVLATAAFALAELDVILAGSLPLAVADHTVEIDLSSFRLSKRRWFRHPDCECSMSM